MSAMVAQAFPFVHPAIAGAALAAGAIPIIIHLINRRRYRRMPWAAMRFLLAANRRSTRRIWLEQILLLMTRVAIVVLMGLAIARPYMPASSIWPMRSSRVHRIVMIDNSLSMAGKNTEGKSRFELAMRCANSLVKSFPLSDAVSIVTLAEPAEAVIAHAAYDRRFVREQLATIKLTQRSTDTVGALEAARKIILQSDTAEGNRAAYFISDLPQNTWQSESAGRVSANMEAMQRLADALADSSVDLNVIPITADSDDNVAVTRLITESPLVGINVPIRIVAEVTNFSSTTQRDVVLQLRRNGEIIRRQTIPKLEPGETSLAMMAVAFSTAGTQLIEAKIIPGDFDALVHDNTRRLSVEVRENTPVLLIDGGAGPTLLTGQAGFLATALSPQLSTDSLRDEIDLAALSPVQVKVITEPELPGESLFDYDVVGLCNVSRLPLDQWKKLERFVAGGGGLMIFGGDRITTDNYNRFGYDSGNGLLPCTIENPESVATHADSYGGYKMEDHTHPVIAEFVGHPSSGLYLARVDQYHPVELDKHRGEVILRYTNDAPALILSNYKQGRVMLSTTTANMDWTNLPAKGDFVSLMFNATAYLSRHHGEHRNLMVGQHIREPLTAAESSLSLRVSGADDASIEPALVPYGEGLALEFGPVEQAGSWKAIIGKEERTFVVNLNPQESNLHAIDHDQFIDALDRPVRLVNDVSVILEKPQQARSTELASITLYSVLILLMVESLIAMIFGAAREKQDSPKGFLSFKRG